LPYQPTQSKFKFSQDELFIAKVWDWNPTSNELPFHKTMKYIAYFLIFGLITGCGTVSELAEDVFMPNYRRILDGNRTFYYMHPTKPNKFSDKKKWQVYFKDERLISSTSWKPDGQKCPETNVTNGNGLLVLYNEDGTELSRSYYKNGKPQKIKKP
jgi:hypothetical protein